MSLERGRSVRARAGSRLHLGLIDPAGLSGRQFGGVGLLVDDPAVIVEASFADEPEPEPFDAPDVDPSVLVRRDELLAGLVATPAPPRDVRCRVLASPPLHSGLGTGTQLSLAIAAAVDRLRRGSATLDELALRTGRGARSAIGVRGFAQGGLLVDGGRSPTGSVAPLVGRYDLPANWRVVLALPEGRGTSGAEEGRAFEAIPLAEPARIDRLARLALLGLVPAALEADFDSFSEAVWEFGRLAAEPFRAAQGGIFASPSIAEVVHCLRTAGARGVAQSSWGPATVAFARDPEEARHLAETVRETCGLPRERVLVTAVRREGAELSEPLA